MIIKITPNKDTTSFSARPIPTEALKKIHNKLVEANEIDIFCHASPDDDAINAAKVFYRWLRSLGKKVRILTEKNAKELFNGQEKQFNIVDSQSAGEQTEGKLALVLDFNSENRNNNPLLNKFNNETPQNVVVLDHHTVEDSQTYCNPKTTFYVDETSPSCCGLVYRFFEGIKGKLHPDSLADLYCGILSDFKKSKLLKIDGVKLQRTPSLQQDPFAEDVLNKVESALPSEVKLKVLSNLDVLSRLSPEEISFRKSLYNENKIKFSKNGNLAYIVIEPNDEKWIALGQDNNTTSAIIGDLRRRLIANRPDDEFIPSELRDKLVKAKGVVVFYRGPKKAEKSLERYQMSITTKGPYSKKLLKYIKEHLDPTSNCDGHPDRAGGFINSLNEDVCNKFINNFIIAAENVQ